MRFAAHRLLRRLGVTAAVLAMVQPIAPTQAAGSAFSRVAEQQLDALWRLPQWQQVMRQLPQQETQVRSCLSGRVCSDPGVLWLAQIIERSRGRSPIQQAAEVNSALNRKPYRTDQEQFGREDVWESPVTFAHLGGDCEDYAIAKLVAPDRLGHRGLDNAEADRIGPNAELRPFLGRRHCHAEQAALCRGIVDLADGTGPSSIRRDIHDGSRTFAAGLSLGEHDAADRLGP